MASKKLMWSNEIMEFCEVENNSPDLKSPGIVEKFIN